MPSVDAIRGCLLGAAIGDALGAGIEADAFSAIRAAHGPSGLKDYTSAFGRNGAITANSQMLLFTIEGIIRAGVRGRTHDGGAGSSSGSVGSSYLRWLDTQHGPVEDPHGWVLNGWLRQQPEMHHGRSPSGTAIEALKMGFAEAPTNSSKGCGAVLRGAGAGLLYRGELAFEQGCEFAAVTHGHPTAALTAGTLAVSVSGLLDGLTLFDAVAQAREILASRPDSGETTEMITWATVTAPDGLPTPEEIDELSAKVSTWLAEGAFAVALRCALAAERQSGGNLGDAHSAIAPALLAAVNHSGPSAATGSIAGCLIGAAVGGERLPTKWVVPVEARGLMETLARDFEIEFGPHPPTNSPDDPWGLSDIPPWWWDRYPGV